MESIYNGGSQSSESVGENCQTVLSESTSTHSTSGAYLHFPSKYPSKETLSPGVHTNPHNLVGKEILSFSILG